MLNLLVSFRSDSPAGSDEEGSDRSDDEPMHRGMSGKMKSFNKRRRHDDDDEEEEEEEEEVDSEEEEEVVKQWNSN